MVLYARRKRYTEKKTHSEERDRGRERDDRWEKRVRGGPGSYLSLLSSRRHQKKRDQTTGSERSFWC